jgi:L-asparagine transporter-like permease
VPRKTLILLYTKWPDDDKKPFFKTPVGIALIVILSIIVLFILAGMLDSKHTSRSLKNNWSNNNYISQGQVPPSLVGYI